MTAYTLAGAVTSTLVGAGLALAGGVLLPEGVGISAAFAAVAVALTAMAREVGWIKVPLPQIGRQTNGMWAKTYTGKTVPILWGLDLGLLFTTRFTFSGVWLLVIVAVLASDPAFGATLFLAHWFGRSLSVWIAPLLVDTAVDTPALLANLNEQERRLQLVHVGGLIWSLFALGWWITAGATM